MCSLQPPSSNIAGVPNLFGVCVYSFMCHHSLPGLVTPISNKRSLYSLMMGDYCLILAFYFLLAYTGIFAFTDINDLYTLNFQVTFTLCFSPYLNATSSRPRLTTGSCSRCTSSWRCSRCSP